MKILVTGGTNGMGKGVATIRELENVTMNKKISIILCDLTKLTDVRLAIDEIQSKHKFLDCIFINAGLGYAAKRVETEDGMDSHFQVNYLSQHLTTYHILLLLNMLHCIN